MLWTKMETCLRPESKKAFTNSKKEKCFLVSEFIVSKNECLLHGYKHKHFPTFIQITE